MRGGVREQGVRRRDIEAAFDFVPVEESHLPMLREWLLRPHVARWWGDPGSLEAMRDEHRRDASQPNATRKYIATLDREPIGFIQSYLVMGSGGGWWEDETDPGTRGIDQFLADASKLGQGIGRAMIGAFVQVLFADPAVTVVQTDPSPTNAHAIRCYQAAGFVAAGIVATPDGDALLMRRSR